MAKIGLKFIQLDCIINDEEYKINAEKFGKIQLTF